MILSEVYSHPVHPTEELVRKTKSALKKPGLLEYTVVSGIILNFIEVLIFVYFLFLGLQSILEKVVLFIIVSTIQNAVILVICLYREEVRAVFTKFETSIR
jgi:cobalamin biosynthesis protein CobD/CbiB